MPSLQVRLHRTVPHFELRREWAGVWSAAFRDMTHCALAEFNCFSFTCSILPFLRPSRAPPWAHTGAQAKVMSSTTGAAATWAPLAVMACPTAAPCCSPCKSLSPLTNSSSSNCLASSSPQCSLIAVWQFLFLLRKVLECSLLSVLCVIVSHSGLQMSDFQIQLFSKLDVLLRACITLCVQNSKYLFVGLI